MTVHLTKYGNYILDFLNGGKRLLCVVVKCCSISFDFCFETPTRITIPTVRDINYHLALPFNASISWTQFWVVNDNSKVVLYICLKHPEIKILLFVHRSFITFIKLRCYTQGCSGTGTRGNGTPTLFHSNLTWTCEFLLRFLVYIVRRCINDQMASYLLRSTLA